MPVDLQKDIRRLTEAVERVPGLSEVCALALGIIRAAQLCARNKLKLQSLAHSTADHLISIAKCFHGRSSNCSTAATNLQDLINELKRVLQEVSYAIQKYSQLSLEATISAARERDRDIRQLEEGLQEVQDSIFSLHEYSDILARVKHSPERSLNYHIGLTVHRPQTAANSHYRSGLYIRRPETTMVTTQGSEFATIPLSRGELKGAPFSRFGLEQDITRSPTMLEATLSEHSFDLSDSFSRVEAPRIGVSDRPPSRTLLSRLKRRLSPNLTESIRNIQPTYSAGGYGDIYSGILTNSRATERVALKLLRMVNQKSQIEKVKKKFRREVSIWCSLRHPNVLPFYGTCDYEENRLFMVSPWAENGKALEYLQRNPDVNRGLLLQQTASALTYLHSRTPPLIHGDVKADNVLISGAGHALLCDFGLSRYVDGWTSSSGSSSNTNGTVRFMAPELLVERENTPAGSKPTKQSDVFAFGSLMLQIYTEKLPFNGITDARTILKIANNEVPARSADPVVIQRGLNDHTWRLMIDCWKPNPSHRPSMEEMIWRIIWASEGREGCSRVALLVEGSS